MALPADVQAAFRSRFPDSVDQIESAGEWDGPAEVLIEDDFETGTSRTVVSLTSGVAKLQVYFAKEPPQLKCGDILRVQGMRLGGLVDAASAQVDIVAAASSCSPLGDQKIAVLLVNFGTTAVLPGNITQPYVNPIFFGSGGHSVDGYWREASYGKTSASGVVLGPYTLSDSLTCDQGFTIANQAIAAADPFVDFSVYNRVFIVMPRAGSGCHAGVAVLGCTTISSPSKGSIQGSLAWLAADSVSPANDAGVQLAAHEGGHTFGLNHASSLSFGNVPLGSAGSAGTHDEYGDRYSDLGIGFYFASYYIGHYAAPHKAAIGWFAPGNVQDVTSSGTFLLQPYEVTTSGLQALRVRRGLSGNSWLWIEYRQPIGYDATFQPYGTQPYAGALIHYEDPPTYPGYTHLLAFDLAAPGSFGSPALEAGSSWQDPYSELSLTVNSATSSGLTITINYQGSPALSISKTHGGNFTQGQTGATYTVNVSNGSGAGATSGTVAVTETVPAGLSLVSMTGTGWSCASNTCSRSDALAGGASYPPITVVVNVVAGASSPLTNQVSVSLGGFAAGNAADVTIINAVGGNLPDSIISPASGSTLSGPPVNICWTNNGNYLHWLDVGTAAGSGDLYGGYQPIGATCKSIANILGNGSAVYARIYSSINGAWQAVAGSSATYTAPLRTFSPPDGTVFTASTVTFSWAPIAGASSYWLDVGPFQGNGSIFAGSQSATTLTVGNITPTGIPIWARLWAFYAGAWHVQGDHSYTACSGCVSTIATPTPSTALAGSSAQFCWTPTAGADHYWLDVGTAAGTGNLYGADQGTATCRTVSSLPTSGIIYVQLFTHMGADWKPPIRYQYLAANSLAQITSPAPNSVLASSTVTFSWTAPPGATGYWLDVGTSLGSGALYGASQGMATSRTVSGIPAGTIWVRLWTCFGAMAVPRDFQYRR